MSSILKALKKLETESSAQEIQGQYLPHSINTRQTVNKRVKNLWIVNRLFSIICIVSITLGIAWFTLSYKSNYKAAYESTNAADFSKTDAEIKTDEQRIEKINNSVPAIDTIADKTETSIPEPEKEITNNKYSSISKPNQSSENTETAPQPKKLNPFKKTAQQPVKTEKIAYSPIPKPEPVKPVPKKLPKPPKTVPAAANQVKKPIKTIEVSQEEKEPENEIQENTLSEQPADTTPAAPVHDSIPEKSASESGLDIQALVWSPESISRMAVINGNILREGGVIEGAVINYIGNDYIIIKKEGKEWKLLFQIN